MMELQLFPLVNANSTIASRSRNSDSVPGDSPTSKRPAEAKNLRFSFVSQFRNWLSIHSIQPFSIAVADTDTVTATAAACDPPSILSVSIIKYQYRYR